MGRCTTLMELTASVDRMKKELFEIMKHETKNVNDIAAEIHISRNSLVDFIYGSRATTHKVLFKIDDYLTLKMKDNDESRK